MGYLSDYYRNEFEVVSKVFPALVASFQNKHWELTGTLEIIDESGKKWDEYEVKIVYPYAFPLAVPKMFETGGRIPKTADYHVNPDGSCCLSVPALEMIILRKGINTIDFLKELAIPYLANHTYMLNKGKYAGEEFGHGALGIYEFYSKALRTEKPILILKFLGKIITNKLPERNELCLCESNKKFKNCHLVNIKYLSPVNVAMLKRDYEYLLKAFNSILSKK